MKPVRHKTEAGKVRMLVREAEALELQVLRSNAWGIVTLVRIGRKSRETREPGHHHYDEASFVLHHGTFLRGVRSEKYSGGLPYIGISRLR